MAVMRALVLSGGGGLGAYQVGVLNHLLGDLEVQHRIVRGVSVGAINGTQVAMHRLDEGLEAARQMDAMWRALRTKDVIKPRFLQPVCLLWAPSTHSFKPLQKYLEERVDMDRLRNSGRDYAAVAVDIVSGDFRTYGPDCSKPQFIRGVLGSSATPILHPNFRFANQVIYDGGIRDVSPIKQAIAAGATEIDLILTQSPKLTKWDSKKDRIWNTGLRVFEIMFREIVEADLDRVELYNAAVESRHPKGVNKRIVTMRVIRPADPLPADSANFEPEQSKKLIDMGYEDAVRFDGW